MGGVIQSIDYFRLFATMAGTHFMRCFHFVKATLLTSSKLER
jgi:hypothetical protein